MQTSRNLQSPVPNSQNCIWEYLYNVSSAALTFSKQWSHWFNEVVVPIRHSLHSLSSSFLPKYFTFSCWYCQREFCYCTFKHRQSSWFSFLPASEHHSFEDILSNFTDCTQSHGAKASKTISSTWWKKKLHFFISLPQKCQSSFFCKHHVPINSDWLNIESGNTWSFSVFFRVHGTKAACLHGITSP